ncbi:MAG: type II secretion system protein GspG [Deltaproteobacteria bacterium]|nr:type II secretion system protein GspG [Deltaproteobacteria bacterium]
MHWGAGICRSTSRVSSPEDPWENEFAIACHGDDVTVASAGPDERFGTADDVE